MSLVPQEGSVCSAWKSPPPCIWPTSRTGERMICWLAYYYATNPSLYRATTVVKPFQDATSKKAVATMRLWAERVGTDQARDLLEKVETDLRHLGAADPTVKVKPEGRKRPSDIPAVYTPEKRLCNHASVPRLDDLELLAIHLTNSQPRPYLLVCEGHIWGGHMACRASITYLVPGDANPAFKTSSRPVFGWWGTGDWPGGDWGTGRENRTLVRGHCVTKISTGVPREVCPASHGHRKWWGVWHCGGAACWTDLSRAGQRLFCLQQPTVGHPKSTGECPRGTWHSSPFSCSQQTSWGNGTLPSHHPSPFLADHPPRPFGSYATPLQGLILSCPACGKVSRGCSLWFAQDR